MENYDDNVFEFGEENNDALDQTNSFNYDSISGLGESNYENEDIFNNEVSADVDFNSQDSFNEESLSSDNNNYNVDYVENDVPNLDEDIDLEKDVDEVETNSELPEQTFVESEEEQPIEENDVPTEEYKVEDFEETNEDSLEQDSDSDNGQQMVLSETPIEELNKLTEYTEDKIETTDISDLFSRVSVNVKDASEIFRKNTDLKQKIDSRFEELKKLQGELESSRKSQLDEVNKYKEEVLDKLTEKKEEIEKRLNLLKEVQSNLEKEKQDFEQYKRHEQENIDKVQREVQSAYDDRREELSHIEDVLRKQKDALDEERNQLSLDKIQYESDKNELANNLLKFNDLVNSFTSGVTDVKEEE